MINFYFQKKLLGIPLFVLQMDYRRVILTFGSLTIFVSNNWFQDYIRVQLVLNVLIFLCIKKEEEE